MPLGICLPFLIPRLSGNTLGIMQIRVSVRLLRLSPPTEGIWWDGWRQDCKNNTEFLIDELRGWRSAGQRLTLDPLAAIGIRRNSLECVQGSGVKRLSESDAEYFERGTVRRTCFREWRKGYNAAT